MCKEIMGIPSSPGKCAGRIQIVESIEEDIEENRIIVLKEARPEFYSQVREALGVITDKGGKTCHLAIICRELEVPCITGTVIASSILKNGQFVSMDGSSGEISLRHLNKTSNFCEIVNCPRRYIVSSKLKYMSNTFSCTLSDGANCLFITKEGKIKLNSECELLKVISILELLKKSCKK